MPAMSDWEASTVFTLPGRRRAGGEACRRRRRRRGVPARAWPLLDVVGLADHPQGQTLLGAHLGDVEARPAVEAHPQGQRAAGWDGHGRRGSCVLPLHPAAPGQVEHQPHGHRVDAQVFAPPGHRRHGATTSDGEGWVEGLEGGDGGQLASLPRGAPTCARQEPGERLHSGSSGTPRSSHDTSRRDPAASVCRVTV